MRITEATAGRTIIPLANGMTDLITIMIASYKEAVVGHESAPEENLALGAIFGGNLFAMTIYRRGCSTKSFKPRNQRRIL
jgi:Ca2+/Na+ antiporter